MKFSEFLSTTVIIACAVESVASHRDNSENIILFESVNEILNDLQELEQEMNFFHNVGSAGVGETCQGFDKSTGSPYPDCAFGLFCAPLGERGDRYYRYCTQMDEMSLSSTDYFYRYILGTVYVMNGDRWNRNGNWLMTNHYCTWYGVSCNADDEVKELNLYYNNVDGTLPKELGDLMKLTYLQLSSNSLRGSIGSEIGQLTNLELLFLNENAFTGSIPSELGLLTGLRYLGLYNNVLSGPIPDALGQLTNLEGIYLFDNAFTGSIPSELGLLTGLRYLVLDNNKLSGTIPNELGQLTNLEYLYIKKNNLSGTTPSALCDNSGGIGIDIDCPEVEECACCQCF